MTARTRADEVRDRRAKRRNPSPAKTRKPRSGAGASLSGRSLPPMVARHGRSQAQPKGAERTAGRGKEARRRFSLSLRTAGAELALPALPNVHVSWRVLSFVMLAAFGYGLYALWTAPQFIVQSVGIEGVTRIPAHEIESVLKVSGRSIFTIDPDAALDDLQRSFPDLADVDIAVGFPATVTIIGAERQPVIAWEQEGVTFWLDAGGYRFVPRGEFDLPRVVAAKAPPAPVVLGGEVDEFWFTTPQMIDAVLTVSGQAPQGADLIYDPQHGLGWVDPERGWNVYFGQQPDQMAVRLQIYAAITETLKSRGLNPAFISVENLHAPYFRMSEQTQ